MAEIDKVKNVYSKITPFKINITPDYCVEENNELKRMFSWQITHDTQKLSNTQNFYLFQMFCLQVSMGIVTKKNHVNEFEPTTPTISPEDAEKIEIELKKVYDQLHSLFIDCVVDKPKRFSLNGDK